MHIVKSIEPFSVAKIAGMIYGCLGLLIAPVFLLIGVMGATLGQNNPFAGIFSVGFAVLIPFLYGVFGFIMGFIGALLYNLFARWVGGVELELEARPEITTAPYPLVPPVTPSI